MAKAKLHTGDPSLLGATPMEGGVNFAVFSAHAEAVELCLFDGTGEVEVERLDMRARKDGIWHAFLPKATEGLVYGYRAHGAHAPHLGHRFNPHKLLLDPYAKALAGTFRWSDRHFAYQRAGDQVIEGELDRRDNADVMYKAQVIGAAVGSDCGTRPLTPWGDTVFYETHVKGFTKLREDLPDRGRGTFDGLANNRILEYLKALGITSIELLPIFANVEEHHLHAMGLRNYWGYNSVGFFAPHRPYLGRDGNDSIRRFVRAAHDRGLEVILDVAYNHTAEGNHLGPTFSFKGLDNKSYYRLSKTAPQHYRDETGCGATLETSSPVVQRLITDSLHYWVRAYGIDGFRFDLAPVLGSRTGAFDRNADLVQTITNDRVLGGCKLIAEPWTAISEGYALGQFPTGWGEWNDKARDAFRGFWRADGGVTPAEFAQRISGSGDLFYARDRGPNASVNMVACHDGFTLRDLTDYSHKHNWANGEGNRDGHNHNLADNFGHEGPSADLAIQALRQRRRYALLATLFLSSGTPLLLGGDEFGRTQVGNNNAYAQDNSTNWFDWTLAEGEHGAALQAFTRHMTRLRHRLIHFDRNHYLPSADLKAVGGESHDAGILWHLPDGSEMTERDWHDTNVRAFSKLVIELDETRGDGALLFAFNAGAEDRVFTLPDVAAYGLEEGGWRVAVDTNKLVQGDEGMPLSETEIYRGQAGHFTVAAGSLILLTQGNVWRET